MLRLGRIKDGRNGRSSACSKYGPGEKETDAGFLVVKLGGRRGDERR
jgi:hypothetical protein